MPTSTNAAPSPDVAGHIVVFDGVLTPQFCDELVREFRDSGEWQGAAVGMQAQQSRSIRNADTILLSDKRIIQKNPKVRERIDMTLYRACGDVIRRYQQQFPFCRVVEGMGFELLRYETGGFYALHTDSFKRVPRELAFSFSLNDDFEGGEWSFFVGGKVLAPAKGSVVVFPSNFMFPHEILPVTRGVRYSVVTWMI